MKKKLPGGRYRLILSLSGVCLFTGIVLVLSGQVSSHSFLPLIHSEPASDRKVTVHSQADTGTLEKMIVSTGNASMDLDLARLNGGPSSRKNILNFAVQQDAFFTVLAFNGEFREALPSSMALIPQNTVAVPDRLNASMNQLAIESLAWGGEYDLAIRDSQSGFTFFNVEGHQYVYNPDDHSLTVQGGRLLLSSEFASAMGRASDAGMVVGSLRVSAVMRPIEVTQIVNGEVTAADLPAMDHPENGTIPGPDVIVGELSGLAQFDSAANNQVGLAVGTDSCNAGTIDLDWFALPSNDHPVIPQNLYRMSGGATNDERFEQIGQSSMKHAFTALTGNTCGFGCNGVGGPHLGSGCSDPYGAGLNSGPGLGSRAWANPFTGFYPRGDSQTPPNNHGGHAHQGPSHRILTNISDLNTSVNQGATYYAEAQYVTPHEYVWCHDPAHPERDTQCNMYNNVSYKRYNVSGTQSPFSFSSAGPTMRSQPAIMAWPGATRVTIQPDVRNDGIAIIGYKVTHPSANVWHYEYALYNQNLDRAISSLTVPLAPTVVITNVGFHAPPQHPGWTFDGTVGNTGYSSIPWSQTLGATSITWSSETLAQNPNANAVRWGTMYNIRFDADHPPTFVTATIGFFKTGAPITVTVLAPRANNMPCIRYDPETPLSCG